MTLSLQRARYESAHSERLGATAERRMEAFRAWRAIVPFSNDQIADAIVEHAGVMRSEAARATWLTISDLARKGHLTKAMLKHALPYLTKTCGVCGKKALYVSGNEGRCSAHRFVQPTGRKIALDRFCKYCDLKESERRERDGLEVKRTALHKSVTVNRRGHK